MIKKVLAATVILSILFGCTESGKRDGNVGIVDLRKDMTLYKDGTSEIRDSILGAHMPELEAYIKVVTGESLSDNIVESWANSLQVSMFTPPTDSVFPSLQHVSEALGAIVEKAGSEGLKINPYRYAAVVYGRPESVLFVDSVMLIALNHYLGADFEGYSHLPSYMRLVKNPDNLPYDLAEALIATSYPFDRTMNNDILARLLYEGALANAKMKVVPDAQLNLALGYTPEQLKWLEENEAYLWRTLVGKDLLYDTTDGVSVRLFSPAPSSRDLDPLAPGRAGRYIGYKIVKAYLDRNPGAEFEFLLSPEFTSDRNSLSLASYNPR